MSLLLILLLSALTVMLRHYHLEVQANPPKMAPKTDAIFSIYGTMGLSHDIFFKFSLRPFEVLGSKFGNHSWKFGSSSRKGMVDFFMTNGSKVLIYLTLLYFIFYCTHVNNAKGNIAKSIKSEIWTVCHTEVYLTFSRWEAKL